MVELRHLRYFVTIAQELHFGRAAAKLNIVQSGLSQQIQALERDVCAQLLKRDKRRVSLTEAGAILRDEAIVVLERIDQALALAREVGNGSRGRLRVRYTRSFPTGICAQIVANFRRWCPDVELELGTGYRMLNVSQLRAGELDAAFEKLPIESGEDLETLQIGIEEFIAAVPAKHRLARKRIISRDDVRSEPYVCPPRAAAPGAWDLLVSQIWGPESRPKTVHVEPFDELILAAVARGLGVAAISGSRASTLKVAGVAYRRFAAPPPRVPIGIAWRKGSRSPALVRFLETAVATVRGDEAPGGGPSTWSDTALPL